MKKNDSDGIFIPIKIGDIILSGRFKNKKIVVKTIGEDEYGMPTVNGKRILNFRFPPKNEKK